MATREELISVGQPPVVRTRAGALGGRLRRARVAYLFVAPAYLLMFVFMAYPLAESLILSFYEWNGIGPRVYVGLDNFRFLVEDSVFLRALKNNLIFSALTTVGTVVLGFLLAVAVERRVLGWSVFKIVYFLPVMMSGTIVGLLWGRLYDPTYGPINSVLKTLGWENPPVWLGDPNVALYAIILVTIWQYAGFPMVMFLAGMESIPPEIHDAATLDGVNAWQRMTQIILPLVKHVVSVMVLLQLIFSFKVFDIIWAMTSGGPGEATTVLGIHLYRESFTYTHFGYGAVIAVVMFAIIFAMFTVYQRVFRVEQIEY